MNDLRVILRMVGVKCVFVYKWDKGFYLLRFNKRKKYGTGYIILFCQLNEDYGFADFLRYFMKSILLKSFVVCMVNSFSFVFSLNFNS